ncbi:hypothetical protein MACH09_36010 [Vibrio sp. MACH09]|uniref:sensor histidine kinase n=1 Tax=Vibrio sp. MACH09 TaxID=3025122 RepID=UPI00278F51B7|nr:HAMP domain-containing sensor histidine kinase [Vibrio sp. MACH09]GLO63093.1 hypothetical protein MACH09_36010 [Vibrio sp. MACH09]
MLSIKRDIYIFLFGLAFGLTAVYSLLMSQSYEIGIKETEAYGFRYEIASIEKQYQATGSLPQLPKGETLQTYLTIDDIPAQYLSSFDWPAMVHNEIYENYLTTDQDVLYLYGFKYTLVASDITLYFVSQYSGKQLEQIFYDNPPEYDQNKIIGMAAGALVLIVFLMVRILIHRITKPVFQLSDWAKQLSENDIPPPSNLRYSELNRLANQLSISVKKQREAVEREEFFLRAASHEMRTPLTIISASVEMLNRVAADSPKSATRAINRISRSVANMQDMVTALLWLSRENTQGLATDTVALKAVVEEVIHQHQHLILDKDITLSINEPTPVQLPREVPELIKIVLVNLIRNSIQHTEQGNVNINLSCSQIEVTNPFEPPSSVQSGSNINTMSFGIGLFLVEKICIKQGWQLTHQQDNEHFIASIRFNRQRPTD